MADRLLVHNAWLVTLDPQLGTLKNADLFIEDGVIRQVGHGVLAADALEIDATDMIVIPGMVDTHRHTWETLWRGLLPDCDLMGYMNSVIWSSAAALRAEDMYIANLLGALDALNAGVTTLLDFSHSTAIPEHSEQAIHGLREAGIRSVFAMGTPAGNAGTVEHEIRRIKQTHFASDDQLLTMGIAADAPGQTPIPVVVDMWRLARDIGARLTTHVGYHPAAPPTPIEQLHELDLLGPDVVFVHLIQSTDEELRLVAETGAKASITPTVEMLMGHGVPATARLRAFGIRPTFGVDVVTSAPSDLITQLRTAYLVDRMRAFEEGVEPTVTHEDVLRFATVDGAEACGLGSKVGTLSVGKEADLVFIRGNMVNTIPVGDPLVTVVLAADVSNIDSVFVKGKAVKRGGQLVGADLKRLQKAAEASRDYVLQQVSRNQPVAPAH